MLSLVGTRLGEALESIDLVRACPGFSTDSGRTCGKPWSAMRTPGSFPRLRARLHARHSEGHDLSRSIMLRIAHAAHHERCSSAVLRLGSLLRRRSQHKPEVDGLVKSQWAPGRHRFGQLSFWSNFGILSLSLSPSLSLFVVFGGAANSGGSGLSEPGSDGEAAGDSRPWRLHG